MTFMEVCKIEVVGREIYNTRSICFLYLCVNPSNYQLYIKIDKNIYKYRKYFKLFLNIEKELKSENF